MLAGSQDGRRCATPELGRNLKGGAVDVLSTSGFGVGWIDFLGCLFIIGSFVEWLRVAFAAIFGSDIGGIIVLSQLGEIVNWQATLWLALEMEDAEMRRISWVGLVLVGVLLSGCVANKRVPRSIWVRAMVLLWMHSLKKVRRFKFHLRGRVNLMVKSCNWVYTRQPHSISQARSCALYQRHLAFAIMQSDFPGSQAKWLRFVATRVRLLFREKQVLCHFGFNAAPRRFQPRTCQGIKRFTGIPLPPRP